MTAMPQAVIVFGASGFLGRNIVNALKGHVAMLIGVTGSTQLVPGCTHIAMADEINSLPALPDDTVAIHVAAFRYDAARFGNTQSKIIQQNINLTSNIFHFCMERKITELRLASSIAVYPAGLKILDDEIPVDLNQPPHAGEECYAWSKRLGEILTGIYAAQFGLNSIVFRLSNPYGPYDSTDPVQAHVAPAFVMKALSQDPVFEIWGDAAVERDFIYVGDVIKAFRHSLSWRGRNEIFNLCTGRPTTLQELAISTMRVAGVDKPVRAGTPGAPGPHRGIATTVRIRDAMNLDFSCINEGMKPTIAWYRDAMAH